MKKWKKILDFLSRLFVRIAHVLEHLICDDVPSVDCHDEDDFLSDDEENV